jgi:hypothetical protein
VANESAMASSGVMAHPRCARAPDLDRNYSATVLFDLLRNSGHAVKPVDGSPPKFPSKSMFFRRFAWHMPCSTADGVCAWRQGKSPLFALGGTDALAYIETLLRCRFVP